MKFTNRVAGSLGAAILFTTASAVTFAAPAFDDLDRLNEGWSAAEILGARVRSAEGEDVGEIEDLVFSADAKVVTAVVSVGGLLGVAEKRVAVPYADLRVWPEDQSLAIPLTRAEAEAAGAYDRGTVVGSAAPPTDPEVVAPPDAADRRAAEAEAARSFAGKDPRVADGIAENKKAYEDERAEPDEVR
jgi:sporulation protein YlmC with PRC-barrel domain